MGITDILLKTRPTPQQLEYLNILKFSSQSLLNLINDILDLGKMEAGQVTLHQRQFNLRELITSLGYGFNIKAQEKGIALQMSVDDNVPEFVVSDEVKIGQVLTNLLGNALKFTEKGAVKLTLAVVKEEQDAVYVSFKVADTGIGIPEDRLAVIFEEYTQAERDTEEKFGGTGLGLTISKRILDLLGSKIAVQSEAGKGTEFSFNLKLKKGRPAPAAGPHRSAIPEPQASLKGVKVLLVEDNKINIMIAEQYLKSWEINYEVARNGLEAIAKINKTDYDVVLMDLHMPVLDGYEATKWIRNLPEPKYRQLPIIALSASAEYVLAPKMKACGLTDFISKPFKPEELNHKIAVYGKKK
jgi:CheY-like chemotaxis protein/two-component sensor histidine kinase